MFYDIIRKFSNKIQHFPWIILNTGRVAVLWVPWYTERNPFIHELCIWRNGFQII